MTIRPQIKKQSPVPQARARNAAKAAGLKQVELFCLAENVAILDQIKVQKGLVSRSDAFALIMARLADHPSIIKELGL